MPINRLTLDARLEARGDLRFTPAGIPVLDMQLAHESKQVEAGSERRVACELAAIALGPIARQLTGIAIGSQLRCHGFLARRYRTGISVALHLCEFELIDYATEGN